LDNGEIAFLGRLDDQVKIRGYRIEPAEIVATLDQYPGIQCSAVVGRDDDGLGPALVAYIVANREARLTTSELQEYLATRLPDYMVPGRFVLVSELPVTANGKLDKSKLPAPSPAVLMPNRCPASVATDAGDSVIAKRVAAIVASLLGQASVGTDENFFMIGGHSMLGVQLVARIHEAFGVKLTLRQLFSAPTIAALSTQVASMARTPRQTNR
jgi:acyl carrier protein